MPIETLQEYEDLAKTLNKFTEEVKIEVLLAALIAEGRLTNQQFRVRPQGLFKRSYRNEIEKVEVTRKKDTQTPDYLEFKIWKEGLFDSLPKGLFHDLRKGTKPQTVAQTKEQLSIQEEEIKAARSFFYPLEQAFYRLRVLIEQEENSLVSGFRNVSQIRELAKQLWQIDLHKIESSKAISLSFFLPHTFRFKGDLSSLGQIFSFLLGHPVKIQKTSGKKVTIEKSLQTGLGDGYLGNTMILGNCFYENIDQLSITLSGLKAKEAAGYVKGGKQQLLLDILCRYLLPVGPDLSITLSLLPSARGCRLPEGKDAKGASTTTASNDHSCNNILGFTTYLS